MNINEKILSIITISKQLVWVLLQLLGFLTGKKELYKCT
jgi:hypothetical protein